MARQHELDIAKGLFEQQFGFRCGEPDRAQLRRGPFSLTDELEQNGVPTHCKRNRNVSAGRMQAAILRNMAPEGKGLTVVGDDDQSIYSFRAADVRNILAFPDQFNPQAKVIKLEDNYRSTGAILATSNAVIGLAKNRFNKTLRANVERGKKPTLVTVADEVEQARYVVARVLANQETGIGLGEQAVLYRNDIHCVEVERRARASQYRLRQKRVARS